MCLHVDMHAAESQKYTCSETLYFVVWQFSLLARSNKGSILSPPKYSSDPIHTFWVFSFFLSTNVGDVDNLFFLTQQEMEDARTRTSHGRFLRRPPFSKRERSELFLRTTPPMRRACCFGADVWLPRPTNCSNGAFLIPAMSKQLLHGLLYLSCFRFVKF